MPDLPDEILEIIFLNLALSGTAQPEDDRYLDEDDSLDSRSGLSVDEHRSRLNALYTICLASKRFYRLAAPILFRTLDFDVVSIKKLPSILRTLCRDPSARKSVKRLKFRKWADPGRGANHEAVKRDSELGQLYQETTKLLAVDDRLRRTLQQELLLGSVDAQVRLLFALCTKVQQLTLSFDNSFFPIHDSSFPTVCGRGAVSVSESEPSSLLSVPLPGLQHLECLEIRSWAPPYDESPLHFPMIGGLPALRTLRLCDVEFMDIFPQPEEPVMISNVELFDALVDAKAVAFMLQAFPAVTTLSIEFGQNFAMYEERSSWKSFGKVLCQCGTNITTLVLALDLDGPADDSERPPLGTLRPLESLLSLTLPVAALIEGGEAGNSYLEQNAGPHRERPVPLAQRLPTSLRFFKLLGPVDRADWALVDSQLADLTRDPEFEQLARIELLHWCSEPARPRIISVETYSFLCGLRDSSWWNRKEVRRAGSHTCHWDIFERVSSS